MPISMDSSSSDDDEFQARLHDVVMGSELGLQSTQATLDAKKSKPSLRHTGSDDEQDNGDGVSSAGFKAHMAKKLSAFLDQSIVEVSTTKAAGMSSAGNITSDDGFRLLSSSGTGPVATYDELVQAEVTQAHLLNQRHRRVSSSGSEDDEEELKRLASAAVSGQDIVGKGSLKKGTTMESRDTGDSSAPDSRQPIASMAGNGCANTGSMESSECEPKKHKRKRKACQTVPSEDSCPECESAVTADGDSSFDGEKKKKKKKKKNSDILEASGEDGSTASPSKKKKEKKEVF